MIRINKPGYIYIFLTILIGFSAVNTANNLLYIITSTLLSYMLVSGIFGRKNLRGLEVTLEFPEERFAQAPVPIGLKLTNRRRFMPAFLVKILVNDESVLFPFVRAGATALLSLNVVFESRGLHPITEVVVSSVFPFNFFTRYRRIPQNRELVIFPRLQRCSLDHLLVGQTRWKGETSSTTPGHESDLISIRNYVSGDPLKYISWKATAKTGRLKTKELSAIEARNVLIDFNMLKEHDLEHTLSCLAYTIIKLLQAGTAVGLAIEGETYKPDLSSSHKVLLLTRLALYGQH